MVLVLWGAGATLANGHEIQGQNCCIASEKWDVNRVSLQEFDIRYIMLKVNHVERMPVISGLMVNKLESLNPVVQDCFPGGKNMHLLFNFDIVNFM